MTVAEVQLWGRTIGAVSLAEGASTAAFEYVPEFVDSGIQLSPLRMPLAPRIYTFPELPAPAFHGLPGLLADSLPDRFGNALIDQWLASQGRSADSFNAVERLCYTGARGMGALEFRPVHGPRARKASRIDVAALVQLASDVLSQRRGLQARLQEPEQQKALQDILRVGTSAGGARAKAVIAWNPGSGEVRSGQVPADPGFGYWLLKFDGVDGNRDKELLDPRGFGAIEYAYALMAQAAGIEMSECRLLEEGGRRHFMTRRFDRLADGSKLHMQSLGALAHFDYNLPGAYSYEQAMQVIRQLRLPMQALEQQFRRMLFNIVARNQDDHVKNIAFLMDPQGQWSLAPAFDVSYSYNPAGDWTSRHQMSMAGKRDRFTLADVGACAKTVGLKRGREKILLEEVRSAVQRWPQFAEQAQVSEQQSRQIGNAHRLQLAAE
ncbi:type II toxin-antitoxin system HipA family toxin [Pseudoxanthomonas dokdonensis]|uniref:Toxin HipA n=1 Tax=Pseudoxanthomonas dokdonensis TaxID=344882 RepID=A0A0R0CIW6_9GAMM|nr:type II toxin-antitoxin system HipA family toxin [Pseudoxanthomonas dokdonensis]KRG69833.1 toxin HipA [Pseudoxanthomonas dokdonensis]